MKQSTTNNVTIGHYILGKFDKDMASKCNINCLTMRRYDKPVIYPLIDRLNIDIISHWIYIYRQAYLAKSFWKAVPNFVLFLTLNIILLILGKPLGKGTFGQVKQGTHILTGEKVGLGILSSFAGRNFPIYIHVT